MFGQSKLDPQKARTVYRAMESETVAITRPAVLAVRVSYVRDADEALVAGQRAKALSIMNESGGGKVLDAGAKVYVIQPGAIWAKVRAVNGGIVGWVMVDAFPKR